MIGVRPPAAETVAVYIGLSGCLPSPLPPLPVTVRSDDHILLTDTPCPPRVYHLLLPARSTTLVIDSASWNPPSVGIDRDETLGVSLSRLSASAGGTPLTVQGHLIPITPMPTGYVSIRRWTGDHRLPHWDFWWWYVLFSDLPAGPLRLLVGLWLAVALILLVWGARWVWKAWCLHEG